MRVVLSNTGSTGDIQPLVALAAELRDHGHQPVLAVSPLFRPRAEQLGIAFVPNGPDIGLEDARPIMDAMQAARTPVGALRAFLEPVMAWVPRMYRELLDACRGADVVIGGLTQPAARMVHETTGIPFVSVQFTPFGVPSAYRTPAGLPLPAPRGPLGRATLGRLYQGLTTGFMALTRRATAPLVNRERVRCGLPPVRDPLFGDADAADLALFAVSRYVARPAPDWPPQYHLTGYFFLDDRAGWQPDADLAAFTEAGPPPVVVTFGSMLHRDAARVGRLVLEAVRLAGCRAVVQQGWSGLARGDVPPDVRVVGYVPHGWLFQRAGCIVHHGGAGTTGAAFRGGAPQVIVPHFADQPLWAAVARGLGVAGPPIPFSKLSAEGLAAALVGTLGTPRYAANAARLGERVRSEQGVRTARLLIEQLVDGAPSAVGKRHAGRA